MQFCNPENVSRSGPPSRASRIAGLMFGAAIGDALGSAFEFLSSATIERALGEPFAWHYRDALPSSLLRGHKAGLPTDDTVMALSAAGVIASEVKPNAESFSRAFLRDLDRQSGRFGKLFWHGGPGGAAVGALGRLATGVPPATCGLPDAGGNGAAMRAHPVGVLHSRDEVLRIAALQAEVTHGHPAAIKAARAVAVTIHDALAGTQPTLDPPNGITERRLIEAWRSAHFGLQVGAERLPAHLLDADMSGWETVATAHAIAYVHQTDPNRAIAAAAASGGDTDTVASIVGAIVGARSGIEALNAEWVRGIQQKDNIRDVIARLLDVRARPSTRNNVRVYAESDPKRPDARDE